MKGNRLAVYFLVFGVALCLRLLCLPSVAFFCDVPLSMEAIESGSMRIQFPGYVPYHAAVLFLSHIAGGVLGGTILFTILCGLLSVFYIMKTAENLGGTEAALLSGIVSGWGIFGIYFSVTGTSYPADMLAVAGVLYHGTRIIYNTSARRDILWVAFWCGLGVVLRPLSSMWIVPASAFLIWKSGNRRDTYLAAFIFVVMLGVLILVSAPFYHSLADVLSTAGPVTAGATQFSMIIVLTNFFRLIAYSVYFFNGWLLLGGALWGYAFYKKEKLSSSESSMVCFLAFLSIPYLLVMARHLPQAGYYCLLLPVICILPLVRKKFFETRRWIFRWSCLLLVLISSMQLFVFKPIEPTSLVRMVANAYFLQYSRAAIKSGTFDTLSSLAVRTGVDKDKVPESRKLNVERGGH